MSAVSCLRLPPPVIASRPRNTPSESALSFESVPAGDSRTIGYPELGSHGTERPGHDHDRGGEAKNSATRSRWSLQSRPLASAAMSGESKVSRKQKRYAKRMT